MFPSAAGLFADRYIFIWQLLARGRPPRVYTRGPPALRHAAARRKSVFPCKQHGPFRLCSPLLLLPSFDLDPLMERGGWASNFTWNSRDRRDRWPSNYPALSSNRSSIYHSWMRWNSWKDKVKRVFFFFLSIDIYREREREIVTWPIHNYFPNRRFCNNEILERVEYYCCCVHSTCIIVINCQRIKLFCDPFRFFTFT